MATSTISTWTWVGATTAWASSGNWTLDAGPGNTNGFPAAGDTALLDSGSVQPLLITGSVLSNNTIDLSGSAVLDFANGSTLDAGSVVDVTSGTATVNATGVLHDIGNIEAVQANAVLTLNLNGGTLISDGLGGADIGLNAGTQGVPNSGTLIVLGGTLDDQEIHVNDGTAEVTSALMNNDLLSVDNGLLEIAQPTTVSPSQVTFVTGGTSTVKFDTPGNFNGDNSGQITGFAANDTIDIGANIIGSIVYSGDLGGYATLNVENTSGSTIFSTVISGGDEANFAAASGSVGATGGTVGSFQVTQGSGDTLITEAATSTTPPPPENFTSPTISDVLFEDNTTGGVALWNIQNGAATSATTLGTLAAGATVVATGDFNGDGRADILTEDASGNVSQWEVQNGAVSGTSLVGTTDPSQWSVAGTGNLYGNSTNSVVFVDSTTGAVAQWEVQDGTAIAATTVGDMANGWSLAAIGNLSGSGNTDNLLFINGSGAVADWSVTNGVATSAQSLGQTSSYWSIAGIGDFNGDGQNDILFRGQGGEIAMWTMQNGTVSGADSIGMTSSDWQIAGIGDYAGNGTDDILFQNTNGDLAAWMMQNGTVESVSNVGATTSAWDVVPSHPLVS